MKEIETKKGILHLGAYLDAYLATNWIAAQVDRA